MINISKCGSKVIKDEKYKFHTDTAALLLNGVQTSTQKCIHSHVAQNLCMIFLMWNHFRNIYTMEVKGDHCCLVSNILRNILFCVLQKKYRFGKT